MKSIFAAGRGVTGRSARLLLIGLLIWLGAPSHLAAADKPSRVTRIFVLLVWDGLRPDFVTPEWTPNLFAMENEGVRFARHHALYPTVTMVNAATLATGAYPGDTTILGDDMYLVPRLHSLKVAAPAGRPWAAWPVDLENSALLAALNGPKTFNGRLLGFESVAQQIRRAGGYVAIVGKRGPTFLFDDSVTGDNAPEGDITNPDYIFVSDDLIAPPALKAKITPPPPIAIGESVPSALRDAYFARIIAGRALPAAKAAALSGRPALVVFWQHNPDLIQHRRGLGTRADLDALKACDANLAIVREAIAALGIANRTDLMVVSDHGFATIGALVPLARLLAAAGITKPAGSGDVIVVANGGSDLVYLSRATFPTRQARRAILQRIVDYAEPQPWAGPLFTRSPGQEASSISGASAKSAGRVSVAGADYRGWINGTFSLGVAGMIAEPNYSDAPDLIVSFRELPDASNRGLTGPHEPDEVFDAHGKERVDGANHSARLVAPVEGVVYSDTDSPIYTTGMGMHGAAGARELRNFCAAAGPDFRHHFVDRYPSGNIDVRATVARAMGLAPADGGDGGPRLAPAGRPLDEALAGHRLSGSTRESTLTVSRKLPTMETTTTLDFVQLRSGSERWSYLDGARVTQTPVTQSK